MRVAFTYLLTLISSLAISQDVNFIYRNTYDELHGMLSDSIPLSFKRAVFISENAFLNNRLSYEEFDRSIGFLVSLSQNIALQGNLIYNETDKPSVEKYAAVFRLMKDSVTFLLDSGKQFTTTPYSYDFDDFWGEKDLTKMFVTKLLRTHKGNCHSLPFLYKILCEQMGVKPYLAMAPNHTYIKIWCKKLGWYNTELTSGYFPIDAWIMASGYVHLSAVQNRIYMDTLSDKQSIAAVLVDLAKGYERRTGNSGDLNFILRCCDLALAYYPNYINGLLLKAETMKKIFESKMRQSGAQYPSDTFLDPHAKALFNALQNEYLKIHNLGYRKMPKQMYLDWLADLKLQKEKYSNKELTKNLHSKDPVK